MADQLTLNNVDDVLDNPLSIGVLSMDSAGLHTALAGVNFTENFVLATLTEFGTETNWEVVKITGLGVSPAITIERAQEGTADQAWLAGATVSLRVTAGTIERARDQVFRLLTNAQGELLLDAGGLPILGPEV